MEQANHFSARGSQKIYSTSECVLVRGYMTPSLSDWPQEPRDDTLFYLGFVFLIQKGARCSVLYLDPDLSIYDALFHRQ